MDKTAFQRKFLTFAKTLEEYVSDRSCEWSIKGFIDIHRNIFTISTDTKVVSKILEIHIFPMIVRFAETLGFDVILTDYQNYYPDMTFIYKQDVTIKYAVDIKTTYLKPGKEGFCNGFTLGSHGEYFTDRTSTKNIQFPYNEYKAHFVLGILYARNNIVDETKIYDIDGLDKISSVIKNISFFFGEKWKIASDISGSGNTANIGSITKVDDILNGKGVFSEYGEEIFDDYWMNYGKIIVSDENGKTKKITKLKDFLIYKGIK
jgi:hypothetical protein